MELLAFSPTALNGPCRGSGSRWKRRQQQILFPLPLLSQLLESLPEIAAGFAKRERVPDLPEQGDRLLKRRLRLRPFPPTHVQPSPQVQDRPVELPGIQFPAQAVQPVDPLLDQAQGVPQGENEARSARPGGS